ncbi:MAG: deoxyribodipyrimidine photo-lyase [Syntrophobacterales bacterium]|jgi:deoxyribodipyrimidine photo-lyase|nr:deoxyribodipyrimidine photo-lyase [Syntrophobacterales bacterium]
MVKRTRIRPLNRASIGAGAVVYWMSRDQRVRDNWALLYAQELALGRQRPLGVVFCLAPAFLGATWRQYGFMLQGLQEVAEDLAALNIPMILLSGDPAQALPRFAADYRVGAVVSDFSPLRLVRGWKTAVAERLGVSLSEVDAHNLVPCWAASPKAEYGAYTLRPKLKRLLPEFLEEFPPPVRHPVDWEGARPEIPWGKLRDILAIDFSVAEVDWLRPGERQARARLDEFLEHRLAFYQERRNNPTLEGQSELSPYLHFGQISAQRVALEVEGRQGHDAARESFLEELIVRRELADNYCLYQPHYETFAGFPAWAQKTLNEHRGDQRPRLYPAEELEAGRTHDELWNAAQQDLVARGKMHGYLRMYWAKKILEWTASPEEAQALAIYLNDKYELDGRDPNGYAGIAWSIGGVHDRAWFERPVFGKIRYMSYNGCRAKFNVEAFINQTRQTSGR